MSEEKQQNPIVAFRHEAEKMSDQFRAALPAHIPVERFQRVLMTAIQSNPKLLRCDRRSLWNSAIKCAQDGLLPDGREAAIVEYRDRERGEIAQYLPMIAGLRKKVRNSGEIATWDVHAAYEKDEFEFELGDEPFIRHKPSLGDRGRLIAVYSIATLKSGEKSRDVMSVAEVEKIRAISRAKNGPWGNPTFYPEMAKKTVARRHSKVLPMSTDLDDLIRRDDDLYDMDSASDTEQKRGRATLSDTLDRLAAGATAALMEPDAVEDAEVVDQETGEVTEKLPSADDTPKDAPATGKPREGQTVPADGQERTVELKGEATGATTVAADFAREVAAEAGEDDFPGDKPLESEAVTDARKRGYEGRRKGVARKAVPGEYRANPDLANAWIDGWLKADDEVKAGGAK